MLVKEKAELTTALRAAGDREREVAEESDVVRRQLSEKEDRVAVLSTNLATERERSASFKDERHWIIDNTVRKVVESLLKSYDAWVINIEVVITHFHETVDDISHENYVKGRAP